MDDTEELHVEITPRQMHAVILAMVDALRTEPIFDTLEHASVPLYHAFLLGVVMQAAGMVPSERNLCVLAELITAGYKNGAVFRGGG